MPQQETPRSRWMASRDRDRVIDPGHLGELEGWLGGPIADLPPTIAASTSDVPIAEHTQVRGTNTLEQLLVDLDLVRERQAQGRSALDVDGLGHRPEPADIRRHERLDRVLEPQRRERLCDHRAVVRQTVEPEGLELRVVAMQALEGSVIRIYLGDRLAQWRGPARPRRVEHRPVDLLGSAPLLVEPEER